MATNRGILLTKSPYFIYETGADGYTSAIEVTIWNGNKTPIPTTPTYVLEKQTLSATTDYVVYEISKIIDDSYTHLSDVYTTTASNIEDALWVSVKSYNGDTNRDDIWLSLNGYSEFLDGINATTTTSVLISERILYHYDDINLRLPVYCDGTDKAYTVEARKSTTVIETIDLSTESASDNSYDKIQYLTFGSHTVGTIDNIIVKNSLGVTIDTLNVIPVDCTKYVPYIVSFINKFGVNQELVFDLVSKKSISVKKKKYNKQLMEIVGGTPTYNTTQHQFKEYNSNSVESITLNTNFIDESLNETISELISSETVWVTVGGVTSPVNISTNTLEYKKSVNDGLVNYTLAFEYAYNKRNTI